MSRSATSTEFTAAISGCWLRLRAKADAAGVPALAITFDPHPVALLRPEKAPVPLVWPEREIALLYGGRRHRGRCFSDRSVAARALGPRVFRSRHSRHSSGHGASSKDQTSRSVMTASGTSRSCETGVQTRGIDFEVVEATVIDGRLVSSSLIRQCLSEGRVQEAARLLGRPHRIRGRVVHGAGRGAGLGFPTANLGAIDTLVPLEGVYAGLAWVDGQGPPWPAACNIGPNPTFGETGRKVEAHLIGFTGDLYGKTVELEFLERLRGTRKFSGLDELLDGNSTADIDKDRVEIVRVVAIPEIDQDWRGRTNRRPSRRLAGAHNTGSRARCA